MFWVLLVLAYVVAAIVVRARESTGSSPAVQPPKVTPAGIPLSPAVERVASWA